MAFKKKKKNSTVLSVFFFFLKKKKKRLYSDSFFTVKLWRSVEQLKHVIDDLPQAVLQREVIVHQIDEEVIVMDIFNYHPRRRLVFIEFAPLLNPQGKRLILRRYENIWVNTTCQSFYITLHSVFKVKDYTKIQRKQTIR